MTRIRILPEHEARKIAAGEVVERPASVVKELLENALDAQATDITLAFHDGGKKRIMITDNGCGMSPDDTLLSIEHHATSKIRSVDELSHIDTFGFRGEALSSIASVSMMRMTTRRVEDECGFEIFVEQGSCIAGRSIVAPVGTSIVVEDLFANVPARRKFLKQRDTEWRAIHQLVNAYALAFPKIGFTLYHDDQLIYSAPSVTTLIARAEQLFPHEIASHFIPCEYSTPSISISGVITSNQVTRYDRKMLFSFVNQRWVKNHVLGKAIINGYEGMLPPAKYPVAALLIEIPKEQVDINVHPRKEEVLLMHPQTVSVAITQAVQKALAQRVSKLMGVAISTQKIEAYAVPTRSVPRGDVSRVPISFAAPNIEMSQPYEPVDVKKIVDKPPYEMQGRRLEDRPTPVHGIAFEPLSNVNNSEQQLYDQQASVLLPEQLVSVSTPTYDIIGQLHATYILLENSEGMMVLDQHAAHEAIIYEQLSKQNNDVLATTLLFPECIPCDENDRELLPAVVVYLKNLGIDAEVWGTTYIMVTASPTMLQNVPLVDLINLILEQLREAHVSTQEVFKKQLYHKLYAMVACKKAVKAGDVLSRDEMKQLITSFMKADHKLHCPHGRPTSWLVSLHDLEKWFKRRM